MPDVPDLESAADQPVSVVLLAYNEEAHLKEVVRGWVSVLQKRDKGFQIVLVDDGSTDQTRSLAEELAEGRDELQFIRHLTHRGLGAALSSGLAAAEHPLIATALCDPAYKPQWLALLLAEIDKVHVVSGYRAGWPMPKLVRGVGWIWRAFLRVALTLRIAPRPGFLGWRGHCLHWFARWIFSVRLRDPACPMRLFRRKILPRIPLQSHGEFALIEQFAKANYLTCYFADEEIPLDVSPSLGKWQSGCGQLLSEARSLFARPDFGPAILETPPPEEALEPS